MTHRNFFWPMTLISVIWLWLTWWWFEFIFVNNMALFLKLLLNIFFQALSSQSQLKIAQWNFENLTFFVDLTKNAVKWNRLKMSSLKEVEWSWKSKQAMFLSVKTENENLHLIETHHEQNVSERKAKVKWGRGTR